MPAEHRTVRPRPRGQTAFWALPLIVLLAALGAGRTPLTPTRVHAAPALSTTTTTLNGPGTPPVYGQAASISATVSGCAVAPTGVVHFIDQTTSQQIGTPALNGANPGVASVSTAALSAGQHQIFAQYTGDTNCAGSNAQPVFLTIIKDGTSITEISSLNPATVGAPVTFTATVTAQAPGSGTPTGTVTFFDFGTDPNSAPTTLGSPTLSGSPATASLTTSSLSTGSHLIRAQYNSDSNFVGAVSTDLNQQVNAQATLTSSSVVLFANPNPSTFQQPVTFTASVICSGHTPTGTVLFLADFGTTPLGQATLQTSGIPPFATTASVTTSTLSVGSHTITAIYSGDGNCHSAQGTLSPNQVVTAAGTQSSVGPTQVVLISSPSNAKVGEQVTFVAEIACANGQRPPSGGVTFTDNGNLIVGTTPNPADVYINGNAYVQTESLTAGSHLIAAQWYPALAPSPCPSATGELVQQIVANTPAVITLTSDFNPAGVGAPVTFGAAVSCTGGVSGGTVTFKNAGIAMTGQSPNPASLYTLSPTQPSSSAVFATSSLPQGVYSITATYSGNNNCAAATSSVLVQTISSQVAIQCTNTAISTAPFEQALLGDSVAISVYAATCPNPEYRVTVTDPHGNQVFFRDYSPSATATWPSAGPINGDYHFHVDARQGGSQGPLGPNASSGTTLRVGPTACTYATLKVTPDSYTARGIDPAIVSHVVAVPGESVTLLSRVSTCLNAVFTFRIFDANANLVFTSVVNGSINALGVSEVSTVWHNAGPAEQTFGVVVSIRDRDDHDQEVEVSALSLLSVYQQCGRPTRLTLSPDGQLIIPQTIQLTAIGDQPCNNPEYRFTFNPIEDLSNNEYCPGCQYVQSDWTSSPTFTIDTTAMLPGTYYAYVDVREAGFDGVDAELANGDTPLYGCVPPGSPPGYDGNPLPGDPFSDIVLFVPC